MRHPVIVLVYEILPSIDTATGSLFGSDFLRSPTSPFLQCSKQVLITSAKSPPSSLGTLACFVLPQRQDVPRALRESLVLTFCIPLDGSPSNHFTKPILPPDKMPRPPPPYSLVYSASDSQLPKPSSPQTLLPRYTVTTQRNPHPHPTPTPQHSLHPHRMSPSSSFPACSS